MTDYWLVLFDLKLNKEETRYYETEYKKDKEKYRLKKYLFMRYLILEDSSDKYFLD